MAKKSLTVPEELNEKLKEVVEKYKLKTDSELMSVAIKYFCYCSHDERKKILSHYYDPDWPPQE